MVHEPKVVVEEFSLFGTILVKAESSLDFSLIITLYCMFRNSAGVRGYTRK